MREQKRSIRNRQQVNTTLSSTQLNVTANPSGINISAPDTRMTQTATALEQFAGGLSGAIGDYYARKAAEDTEVGRQKAILGKEPDVTNKDEVRGHALFSSLANGIQVSNGFKEIASSIDVADDSTWNGHATPQDALQAAIQATADEHSSGMPTGYKKVFLQPIITEGRLVVDAKQQEYLKFHKAT